MVRKDRNLYDLDHSTLVKITDASRRLRSQAMQQKKTSQVSWAKKQEENSLKRAITSVFKFCILTFSLNCPSIIGDFCKGDISDIPEISAFF
jgi:hypothetical protein